MSTQAAIGDDAQGAVKAYEALRHHVLAGANTGCDAAVVVLLRQGVAGLTQPVLKPAHHLHHRDVDQDIDPRGGREAPFKPRPRATPERECAKPPRRRCSRAKEPWYPYVAHHLPREPGVQRSRSVRL